VFYKTRKSFFQLLFKVKQKLPFNCGLFISIRPKNLPNKIYLCTFIAYQLKKCTKKRFQIKIQKYFRVLNKHISTAETVLDLGVKNFFKIIEAAGYSVKNTTGKI
jgi:hypothetical protein